MRQVVITGIGAITSLGYSQEELVASFKEDTPFFERASIDKNLVVSPVHGFDLKSHITRFKNKRYLTRGASFALAAAAEAVKNASISETNLERAGLFVGVGPNLDIGGEFPSILNGEEAWDKTQALWLLKFLPNTPASAITHYLNIHGESQSIGTACAASLQAMGQAFQKIQWGELDMALAGGGDSRLTKGGLMAYKKAGALYTGKEDPSFACRPFDKNRAGFVCGEGGAFFLFEEMEKARKRGAVIHGEILGFSASSDGHTMTAPEPEGRWAQVAIERAVQQSGIELKDIDLVSAHGTSTLLNDQVEAEILSRVFKETSPAIVSFKSWIGHLSAACGAAELALSLFCSKAGLFPPVRNLEEPCLSDLNYARTPIDATPDAILIENFGFGGQNAAMVVKPWKE